MQANNFEALPIVQQPLASSKRMPENFGLRLLYSLPLMVVAGFCLFGYFDTFEPMPRIIQLSWRAGYVCAGLGSVAVICWMWLKPRRTAPAD